MAGVLWGSVISLGVLGGFRSYCFLKFWGLSGVVSDFKSVVPGREISIMFLVGFWFQKDKYKSCSHLQSNENEWEVNIY